MKSTHGHTNALPLGTEQRGWGTYIAASRGARGVDHRGVRHVHLEAKAKFGPARRGQGCFLSRGTAERREGDGRPGRKGARGAIMFAVVGARPEQLPTAAGAGARERRERRAASCYAGARDGALSSRSHSRLVRRVARLNHQAGNGHVRAAQVAVRGGPSTLHRRSEQRARNEKAPAKTTHFAAPRAATESTASGYATTVCSARPRRVAGWLAGY